MGFRINCSTSNVGLQLQEAAAIQTVKERKETKTKSLLLKCNFVT